MDDVKEIELVVTDEMKSKLERLANLCDEVSSEVCDNEETAEILNLADELLDKIDAYLGLGDYA